MTREGGRQRQTEKGKKDGELGEGLNELLLGLRFDPKANVVVSCNEEVLEGFVPRFEDPVPTFAEGRRFSSGECGLERRMREEKEDERG